MEGTRAIGYVYVTEDAKADLAEQAAAISRCCHARGLELQSVVHDVAHSETGHHRPSLIQALEQVAGGHVDTLVVARLGDLAFDAASDVRPLQRWFDEEHRSLIALERGTVAAVPELDEAHRAHARWRHDPAGDRRRAQRGRRADAARRCHLATVQRATRDGLPTARVAQPRDRASAHAARRSVTGGELTSMARAPRRAPGACASP